MLLFGVKPLAMLKTKKKIKIENIPSQKVQEKKWYEGCRLTIT